MQRIALLGVLLLGVFPGTLVAQHAASTGSRFGVFPVVDSAALQLTPAPLPHPLSAMQEDEVNIRRDTLVAFAILAGLVVAYVLAWELSGAGDFMIPAPAPPQMALPLAAPLMQEARVH